MKESEQVTCLYLGAAGVVWALDRLARAGSAARRRDWTPVAATLPERYAARPDFEEDLGGALPSLLLGEAGVLLVAHAFEPRPEFERRLLDVARSNVQNPSRELLGAPRGRCSPRS